MGRRCWCRLLSLTAAVILLIAQPVLIAKGADETILGQCSRRLKACDDSGHTSKESDFGNFMTDAMRWYSGADVALLPSVDIGNHLQAGDVTEEDLKNCLLRDMPLATASLTAAEICGMLEHSVSQYVLNEDQSVDWSVSEFDGFLQISGIQVTYNLTAPAGERILSVTADDGTVLEMDDRETYYTVISTEECFSGGYGYTELENYTLIGTELMAATAYITREGIVSAPEDSGRIVLGGSRESFIANPRMVGMIIAVLGLMFVYASVKFHKLKQDYKFFN